MPSSLQAGRVVALLACLPAAFARSAGPTTSEEAAREPGTPAASAASAVAPAPAPRKPAGTWDFGRVEGGQPLTFSPDGTKLYVGLRLSTVNVWAMAVWYWPEILAVPLMLGALVRVRRLLRDRRIPGEPYCRPCGYHLRGLTSERCPECGAPLNPRNRRIAGNSRRRAALLLVLLAGVPLAYHAAGDRLTPMRIVAGSVFTWRSHAVWEWAEPKGILLPEWVEECSRIVELDCRRAGSMRVVREDPEAERPRSNFCLAPDGESYFLVNMAADGVGRYDIRTGERLMEYSWPSAGFEPRFGLELRLSGDGTRLNAKCWTRLGRITLARAWRLADGTFDPEATDSASDRFEPKLQLREPYPTVPVPIGSPVTIGGSDSELGSPLAVFGLTAMVSGQPKPYLGVFRPKTQEWVAVLPLREFDPLPMISSDGRRVAVVERDTAVIDVWDLSDLLPAGW